MLLMPSQSLYGSSMYMHKAWKAKLIVGKSVGMMHRKGPTTVYYFQLPYEHIIDRL